MTNQKIKLTVVRHGETNWNKDRRIQGQTDVPLNDRGIAQASAVANTLRTKTFDRIVSSDLSRARQTAQPNEKPNRQLVLEPLIRERHLGILEGLLVSDAKEQNAQDLKAFQDRSYAHTPCGAESMDQFIRRIQKSLIIIHQKYNEGTSLIVTHGGVIDVLWRLANNIGPGSKERPTIENGSIHQFIYNPGTRNVGIENFNQTEHLRQLTTLSDI